jgi:hypothetical protein
VSTFSKLAQFPVAISTDAGTGIVVSDSQRAVRASGAGNVTVSLPPGLYKVRYQAANTTQDHVFEVVDRGLHLRATPLEFRTPMPLRNTSTTHEFHEGPASRLSTLSLETAGVGSEIALFVRDSAKRYREGSPSMPWKDLSLREPNGDLIRDWSTAGIRDADSGYGAMRVALNPGWYWLSLSRENEPALRLPVIASDGWCATVYVDCIGAEAERVADLYTASVIVSRPGERFRADDDILRLTELAKQMLGNGRGSIDTDHLGLMLDGKFEYPMLGIFAGHILRLRKNPNLPLLRIVVQNLEKLLPGHPDVVALRIAVARLDSTANMRTVRISGPPMLRASWDVLTEASTRMPDLLPVDAAWMDFALSLSGSRLWLVSLDSDPVPESAAPMESEGANTEALTTATSGTLGAELTAVPTATSGILRGELAAAAKHFGVEWLEDNPVAIANVVRALLQGVDGKIDWHKIIAVLSTFRQTLEDPDIARTPLEQILRRKLIALIDGNDSIGLEHQGLTLESMARDFRVPPKLLLNALQSLVGRFRRQPIAAASLSSLLITRVSDLFRSAASSPLLNAVAPFPTSEPLPLDPLIGTVPSAEPDAPPTIHDDPRRNR